MKRRKLVASLIALVLALSLIGSAVLAKEYDIGESSVGVAVKEDGKTYVTYKEVENEDTTPVVITGSTTDETHQVIITAAEGQDVEVTFNNVSIDIDISGDKAEAPVVVETNGGTATLNFEGENTLQGEGPYYNLGICHDGLGTDNGLILNGEDKSSLNAGGVYFNCDWESRTDVSVEINNMDLTTGDIAVNTMGDSSLTVKDSKIDSGYMTVRAGDDGTPVNVSLVIEDSTVDLEGNTPWQIQSNSTLEGEGSISLKDKNSNVTVNSTGDPELWPCGAMGIGGMCHSPVTVELVDCQLEENLVFADYAMGDYLYIVAAMADTENPVSSAKIVSTVKPGADIRPVVVANEDGTFTITGATLKQFVRLKVDGKTLSTGDFTLTEEDGALKLVFADAFLAGLSAGAHTAEIIFGSAYTLFTIVK